jgi:hypothetical protein
LIHTLALAGESDSAIVKSSQEETRRLPELFTSTGKVLLSSLDGTDWKKLAEIPEESARSKTQSMWHHCMNLQTMSDCAGSLRNSLNFIYTIGSDIRLLAACLH